MRRWSLALRVDRNLASGGTEGGYGSPPDSAAPPPGRSRAGGPPRGDERLRWRNQRTGVGEDRSQAGHLLELPPQLQPPGGVEGISLPLGRRTALPPDGLPEHAAR